MEGFTFGSHPLTVRLLKGVFEQRPSRPRYTDTWDVSVVLNHLRGEMPLRQLGLCRLTHKLLMLIALVTAQRSQTIHLLDTAHMSKAPDKFIFHLSKPIKTSRPGKRLPIVELCKYEEESLCVYQTLEHYLQRTESLRKDSMLFISYAKPHKAVGKETISRWMKETLRQAGIDVEKYKAHSTRSAAASAACQRHLPIQDILAVAGWSRETTFQRFYHRQSDSSKTFAAEVLARDVQ